MNILCKFLFVVAVNTAVPHPLHLLPADGAEGGEKGVNSFVR